jgi:hypothetical protein
VRRRVAVQVRTRGPAVLVPERGGIVMRGRRVLMTGRSVLVAADRSGHRAIIAPHRAASDDFEDRTGAAQIRGRGAVASGQGEPRGRVSSRLSRRSGLPRRRPAGCFGRAAAGGR